jgi:hypothetical protein
MRCNPLPPAAGCAGSIYRNKQHTAALTSIWEADDADVCHHPQQKLEAQLLARQAAGVVLPVGVHHRHHLGARLLQKPVKAAGGAGRWGRGVAITLVTLRQGWVACV